MTDRYIASFVNAAYVGPKSPTAPTTVTALKGNMSAEISFSGASSAYGAITGYRVMSTPGNFIGTGASSPIAVTGLTNGVSYTFKVTTINTFGESDGSVASNAVIPSVEGQRVYEQGTFTFIVPVGITSVSVVCVGGGGASGYGAYNGGAGGGLRYKNNIAVTPGQSIAVSASGYNYYGSVGGNSSFGTNGSDAFYFFAGGGQSAGLSGGTGTTIGGGADGGGNGGATNSYMGGGGAAGYSGNGGDAGVNTTGGAGSGGGGGGGIGYQTGICGGGGGVGLLGQGANGAGGYNVSGSGGNESEKNGQPGSGAAVTSPPNSGNGAPYGGGGGGAYGIATNYMSGGPGAVRIIWPATGGAVSPRSFPSTNTGNI
jgi:hypothetical protein